MLWCQNLTPTLLQLPLVWLCSIRGSSQMKMPCNVKIKFYHNMCSGYFFLSYILVPFILLYMCINTLPFKVIFLKNHHSTWKDHLEIVWQIWIWCIHYRTKINHMTYLHRSSGNISQTAINSINNSWNFHAWIK